MRLVLDASAAVAWASPDEAPPAALAEAVAAARCVAPGLWAYEVHNVLHVLARRGRLDTAGYEAAVSALAALDVELESPSWAQVEHAVTRLARLHGLSIYDAAYLELALRERLPLATFDSDLARAARKEGLALIA
jgi:predicted nucleic acid-binding protein